MIFNEGESLETIPHLVIVFMEKKSEDLEIRNLSVLKKVILNK